jgi:hypothetical protein
MDQPLNQGQMGVGSFERQPDKQQVGNPNKNMNEIYDMLEKL